MRRYGIIRASVKGDKELNQDAIRFMEDGDLLVLALADGVGSAPMSHHGAKAACRAVTDTVRKSRRGATPLSSAEIVHRWEDLLGRKGLHPEECWTTSSFVIVNRAANRISMGHVGDCRIVVRADGKTIDVREEKDFLNETEALGSHRYSGYRMTSVDYCEDYAALIVSDGIGDELEDETIPGLIDYFKDTYSHIPEHDRNYRLSLDIRRTLGRRNGDDKSIIFVWKD